MPFLPMIFTFLKSNWKMVGIGLLGLAIAAYIGILRANLSKAQEEADLARSDANLARSMYKALAMNVEKQNQAITAMGEAQKQQKLRSDLAKKELSGKLVIYQKKIEELQNAKPDPKLSDCDNTANLLRR